MQVCSLMAAAFALATLFWTLDPAMASALDDPLATRSDGPLVAAHGAEEACSPLTQAGNATPLPAAGPATAIHPVANAARTAAGQPESRRCDCLSRLAKAAVEGQPEAAARLRDLLRFQAPACSEAITRAMEATLGALGRPVSVPPLPMPRSMMDSTLVVPMIGTAPPSAPRLLAVAGPTQRSQKMSHQPPKRLRPVASMDRSR